MEDQVKYHSVNGSMLGTSDTKQVNNLLSNLDHSVNNDYALQGFDVNLKDNTGEFRTFCNTDNFILAKYKGRYIGLCYWKLDDYYGCVVISALYVSVPFRGFKIGSKLLDKALSNISENYAGKLVSIGVLPSNTIAYKLYKSRGFNNVCHLSLFKHN